MKKRWKRLPALALAAVMIFGQARSGVPIAYAEGEEAGISVNSAGVYQIGADTFDTLAEAVEAAKDGDEILVLADTEVSETAQTGDKKLTIRGADGVTPVISRDPAFLDGPLLSAGAGGSLKLENLVFDGGAPNAEPDIANAYPVAANSYYIIPVINDENDIKANVGMVTSSGTLEAVNVTFQNSWSTSSAGGGAVYADGGSVSMNGCTFDHNLNPKGAGICIQGKASAEDGSCTVASAEFTDCTFREQFAYEGSGGGHGGGVWAENVENVSFTGCEFTDNTVSHWNGGAMCVESSAQKNGQASHGNNKMKLTVTGCTFTGNTVGNDGFAISLSCESQITGSTFTENRGLSPGQSIATVSYGPRAQIFLKSHYVADCVFEGNSGCASIFGDHNIYQYITVERCKFIGNKRLEYASSSNGLFLLWSSDTNFTDCEFTGNPQEIFFCGAYAPESGYPQPYLGVKNCSFTENSRWILLCRLAAQDGMYDEDRRILPFQVDMENCVIQNNHIIEDGAFGKLFYLYEDCDVRIKDTSITQNTVAGSDQYLIYLRGTDTLYAEGRFPSLTLENTVIQKNGSAGHNIFVIRGKLDVAQNSTVSYNTTENMGGGICAGPYAEVSVDGTSTVHNNHSAVQGDDFVIDENAVSVTIPEVGGQNLILDDCGQAIDGWYTDTNDTTVMESRYDDDHDNNDCKGCRKGVSDQETYTITGSSDAASRYLKAAHQEIEETDEPDTPETPDDPKTPDISEPSGGDGAAGTDRADTGSAPDTGDENPLWLWVALCAGAMGALILRRQMKICRRDHMKK